jgi:GT2 family glycosyltransferase
VAVQGRRFGGWRRSRPADQDETATAGNGATPHGGPNGNGNGNGAGANGTPPPGYTPSGHSVAQLRLQARIAELEQQLNEARYETRRLERRRKELDVALARAATLVAATRADIARANASDCFRVLHGTAKGLAKLRGQPPTGDGALAKAIARIDATDLTPKPLPQRPQPPKRPPKPRVPRRDIGEREARRRFMERYRAAMPPGDDAELGGVLPFDRAGILVGAERPPGTPGPTVDVVVCVHDALDEVRACLWSLLVATARPIHLILVDDGSSAHTARALADFVARHPDVTLLDNGDGPHGYTYAANLGLRASTAEWVVFLNSDTIVTRGWLARLLAAADADPHIGLVGPLSNAATLQSVPAVRDDHGWAVNELPPWLTPDGMAFLVGRTGEPLRPRVPFLNGFCLGVRRSVIEAVGEFDEARIGPGYGEENDYALRAAKVGFSLAIADDAYVHHHKSASYGAEGRADIAPRHFRALLDKHGADNVRELAAAYEADDRLDARRARLAELLEDPGAVTARFTELCPDPLRVAFVLPNMARGGSGGIHSLYQETSGMRRLGIDAIIAISAASYGLACETYADAADAFVPFEDPEDLLRRTADREVIVATHFKSVVLVAGLRAARDDFLPAYYIQDYEPFFFANINGGSADGAEASASYDAVPDALLFAKTHWLANIVGAMHGHPVAKVQPSIDESLFNAERRERPAGGPVRVTAMVRPRTWRRQPAGTVALLERLQAEFGDRVEIVTFGCTHEALDLLCGGRAPRFEHRGVLTRDEVAALHCESDVFLDFSVFQAMGRTAFEAMCCGCAAVLTRVGGPYEFARDGENALLVDPLDDDAAYRALAGLVTDPERRRRLSREGARDARRRSVFGAVLSEYVLFEDEHRRRGLPRLPAQGAAAAADGTSDGAKSSAHWRIARRKSRK